MIKKQSALAAFSLSTALGLAIGGAVTGSAQDITAEPNSDTVFLSSGFTPDPTSVDVISGGDVDVSDRIDGCTGYISDAPDVRLSYTADGDASTLPLYIYARSDGDTTLLINAPDGSWYCNDDSSEGNNPLVVFGPAMTGDYEIWVGSFDNGEYHEATLEISELGGD